MQSRRNFIGQVAHGLAGTLAASNGLGADSRVRLGIIGPGDRGKEILREAGVLDDVGGQAGPGDLIIALRTSNAQVAEAAMIEARRLLDRPRSAVSADAWRPRTLRGAIQQMPDANLALISVPGDFAAAEARKALRRGLDVTRATDILWTLNNPDVWQLLVGRRGCRHIRAAGVVALRVPVDPSGIDGARRVVDPVTGRQEDLCESLAEAAVGLELVRGLGDEAG